MGRQDVDSQNHTDIVQVNTTGVFPEYNNKAMHMCTHTQRERERERTKKVSHSIPHLTLGFNIFSAPLLCWSISLEGSHIDIPFRDWHLTFA